MSNKETVEEAAENEYLTIHEQYQYDAFIKGAKWQQQRMYSKEEVDELLKLLKQTTEYEVLQSFRDKVDQFKKK
jgi:hypothetical protein